MGGVGEFGGGRGGVGVGGWLVVYEGCTVQYGFKRRILGMGKEGEGISSAQHVFHSY